MTRILVLTQTLGLPGCGTVISQTYGTSTEERTTREIVDDTAIVARIKKAYLEESRENLLRRRPARSLTTRGRWMAWWPSDPSCRSRPSNFRHPAARCRAAIIESNSLGAHPNHLKPNLPWSTSGACQRGRQLRTPCWPAGLRR